MSGRLRDTESRLTLARLIGYVVINRFVSQALSDLDAGSAPAKKSRRGRARRSCGRFMRPEPAYPGRCGLKAGAVRIPFMGCDIPKSKGCHATEMLYV